jgi:DNA gyrase subunit A
MRAKYIIEERKGGRNAIVVTEIPYQVNKARLVEKIAELARDKKIEGIVDLRDESNRNGIRIVIEVKKDVNVNVVVNKLFKHTQMQDSFGIIMLGLVDGQPRTLSLKEVLENYLQHRQQVIRRATEYDLKIARDRLHIVEGLRIAIDNLDEIVTLIRNSKDRETARNGLMSRFELTEKQANAILDMRLAQLTGLERSRIEQEYKELLAKIQEYLDILARPERVMAIIGNDLDDIKKRYGDERRTEIVPDISESEIEDFIDDHEVMITLSNRGYVKRQPIDAYKSQRRGGKGVIAGKIRTEDAADSVVVTSVLANLLFFTNQGRVFSMKAYKIPESTRQAKGLPIINLIELRPGEMVTTLVAARVLDDTKHLIMVTRQGVTKKVALSAFSNIRKTGLIAVNLHDDDELVGVRRVESGDRIMIASSQGFSITFDEKQVRPMGRTAAGVKGIRLGSGDYVVGIDKYREEGDVLLVTEKGYGKRTRLEEFKEQHRGGKGLKTIDITEKNGPLVAFKVVTEDEELVILTGEGHVIRLLVEDISVQKRYSRGVLLIKVSNNDKIVGLARFKAEKEE